MLQPRSTAHSTEYDFSGYRRPACYVMALVALKTASPQTTLRFRVDNILVAHWLSARLKNQSYFAQTHHDAHSAWVTVQTNQV